MPSRLAFIKASSLRGFALLLSGIGFVALASCSAPAPEGMVNTGGIAVSSARTTVTAETLEWNGESLPVLGDARDRFLHLGPDYLAAILRDAADAE